MDSEDEMAAVHTTLARAEAPASKAGHAGPSVRDIIFHSRDRASASIAMRESNGPKTPLSALAQSALIRKGLEKYHFIFFDEILQDRIEQLLLMCGQPPSFSRCEPIPSNPIIEWCKSFARTRRRLTTTGSRPKMFAQPSWGTTCWAAPDGGTP
ncbi:hypothetical protein CF336_g7114 [Tilletia laevis]|nr:hypothetical protein CF336_g7114 [Tilletia laevis]